MADLNSSEKRRMQEAIAATLDAECIADAVAGNCAPKDIFGADVLGDWAKENGFTPNDELDDWALDNGYTKNVDA